MVPNASGPVRVGAVDIGSNAVRLFAVEFDDAGRRTILEETRVPVRLGHDVFTVGHIRDESMDAVVRALEAFHARLDRLRVRTYRAVATSASRESTNGSTFVARVSAEAGVEVEVISGAEEARLVYVAVRARASLGLQKWLIAELGGGSIQLTIADESQIYGTDSYPLGAVRMLEAATGQDAVASFSKQVEQLVTHLDNADYELDGVAGMIATGGNAEAIARLIDPRADVRSRTITVAELTKLRAKLGAMSVEERIRDLRLERDRADVIVPAAMVYERVAALARAQHIVVPGVGVKDGIVLDLFENLK